MIQTDLQLQEKVLPSYFLWLGPNVDANIPDVYTRVAHFPSSVMTYISQERVEESEEKRCANCSQW